MESLAKPTDSIFSKKMLGIIFSQPVYRDIKCLHARLCACYAKRSRKSRLRTRLCAIKRQKVTQESFAYPFMCNSVAKGHARVVCVPDYVQLSVKRSRKSRLRTRLCAIKWQKVTQESFAYPIMCSLASKGHARAASIPFFHKIIRKNCLKWQILIRLDCISPIKKQWKGKVVSCSASF
jgi:hypothetical protein